MRCLPLKSVRSIDFTWCSVGGGVDSELGLVELSLGANNEFGDMVRNT